MVARALLLLVLTAATAARAEVAPRDDVVVTGTAETAAERRAGALGYLKGIGLVTGQRATARWTDPVCPKVTGIDPALATQVVARVREIAADAGAKVARPGCSANLTIVFVSDAPTIAQAIARRAPRNFAEVAPARRLALLSGEAPIRWWYTTEVRARDGEPATSMESPMISSLGGSAGQVLPANSDTRFVTQPGNSFVRTMVVRVLRRATVLIDANRVGGKPLSAVADYAAMVGLLELDVAATPPAESVMALFTDGAATGVTPRDTRLLRAVYALPLDRLARQQRARLATDLAALEDGGR